MEGKGTRLITVVIILLAVIVSVVLIIVLDGAERAAIAAATENGEVVNPEVVSQVPTYEHDEFLKCSAIYKKEDGKVICYIQNTASSNYSVNYTLSYKDENNKEISNTTGTINEIIAGDYRFAIVDQDIPANVSKVDLYAKAKTINTKPFKVQVQTNNVDGNIAVSVPAYNVAITLGDIQVCWMDQNNGIIDVKIYPYTNNLSANTPCELGAIPLGTAKQVAISMYGYTQ